MTDAQSYVAFLTAEFDFNNPPPPKVKWQRFYGRAKNQYTKSGQPVSSHKYLGFADGSRVRIVNGGEMTALPPR